MQGEHTGIGRGCRGPPQCSAEHEKTERRNKKQTTCQQSTKRWQSEGIHSMASWEAVLSAVCGGEERAGDGLETGVRSWLDGMQMKTHKNKCGHFDDKKKMWAEVSWVKLFLKTEIEMLPTLSDTCYIRGISHGGRLIFWYTLWLKETLIFSWKKKWRSFWWGLIFRFQSCIYLWCFSNYWWVTLWILYVF